MAHELDISSECDMGAHERCHGCDGCSCHTERSRRTNTSRHGDDYVRGDAYNPSCVSSSIRHGARPAHFEG